MTISTFQPFCGTVGIVSVALAFRYNLDVITIMYFNYNYNYVNFFEL